MKNTSLILIIFVLIGCTITINSSKKTNAISKYSDLSAFANTYFWSAFHEGDYSKIDSALYYLSAAYNENPNHLETVAHLGFTHMWAISERQPWRQSRPR